MVPGREIPYVKRLCSRFSVNYRSVPDEDPTGDRLVNFCMNDTNPVRPGTVGLRFAHYPDVPDLWSIMRSGARARGLGQLEATLVESEEIYAGLGVLPPKVGVVFSIRNEYFIYARNGFPMLEAQNFPEGSRPGGMVVAFPDLKQNDGARLLIPEFMVSFFG